MTSKDADTIANYVEKCTQLLQSTSPESDEHLACSYILAVFEQNKTEEPDILKIASELTLEATNIRARRFGTPKDHAKAARVRKIVKKWADDFKRDTGLLHKSESVRRTWE